MSIHLRKAVENRRKYLIDLLISKGIFKKNELHLFELTLTDLEQEYEYTMSTGYNLDKKMNNDLCADQITEGCCSND